MKVFFCKLIAFILLVGVPYYYFQYNLITQRDAYYWKATQSANHLILGGSRAFKGILPSVIKEELHIDAPIINFAFNGLLSPYGEPYYNAIKRKLTPSDSHNGLYILSVAPGSIMDFEGGNGRREEAFRFYQLWDMNALPNVEYVFRNPRPGSALLVRLLHNTYNDSESAVHHQIYQDGAQSTFVKKGTIHRGKKEDRLLQHTMYRSSSRENSLKQLVNLLADRGNVFLIRIPVSQQMLAEENQIYEDFNWVMEKIAADNKYVKYFNWNDITPEQDYRFSDGHHHLEGESAQRFSFTLAQYIKNHLDQ
ncbi:MAG: hypothetical protein ACRBG0_07220 [Lewinella sp.]|uniref:hypothetical protein n=1 Tax=Lewinella sp. TaxID=2004506 RepID=UPI003D6AFE50